MVSKKSLGDLGWEVMKDSGRAVWIKKPAKSGYYCLCINRETKRVGLDNDLRNLSFAEIAAILDFIVEDAIY